MTPIQRATRAAEGWLEMCCPDEAWEELESLAPELRADPAVILLRVKIYLAKGMPAEAAIIGMGLLCMVPASMSARALVSEAMEKQGLLHGALEVFESAPPEAKKDAVHYFHEGRLLVRLGRAKQGCARLMRAVELDQTIRERILACEDLEEIWWLTPREE